MKAYVITPEIVKARMTVATVQLIVQGWGDKAQPSSSNAS